MSYDLIRDDDEYWLEGAPKSTKFMRLTRERRSDYMRETYMPKFKKTPKKSPFVKIVNSDGMSAEDKIKKIEELCNQWVVFNAYYANRNKIKQEELAEDSYQYRLMIAFGANYLKF